MKVYSKLFIFALSSLWILVCRFMWWTINPAASSRIDLSCRNKHFPQDFIYPSFVILRSPSWAIFNRGMVISIRYWTGGYFSVTVNKQCVKIETVRFLFNVLMDVAAIWRLINFTLAHARRFYSSWQDRLINLPTKRLSLQRFRTTSQLSLPNKKT